MRLSVAGRWLAMSCVALLAACGGGGGGGSGGDPSLSFTPATLSGSVQQGEVGTLTISATVLNADKITSTAWLIVEDPDHVLTGGVDLSSIDASHFSATLHSSPSLSIGHHRGSFPVHVCKDQQCGQKWTRDASLAYDIDVEAAPLQVAPTTATDSTVPWKGTDTDRVTIAVSGGTQWTAASGASWLVVSSGATGTSPGTVTLGFATGPLAEGDYSTDVTVSSGTQSVRVPVTLHVVAPQFVIDSGGSPVFTAINGAPVAPQSFSFELDSGSSVPWSLSSDSAWLLASATSGTTPASVTLSVDPSVGPLAAGAYDGVLTLSSTGIANRGVPAHLQLIKPTLSASVPSVTLGGARGRDLLSSPSVLLALNTGSNAYPVSMSASASWLSISPAQPVVGQSGTTLTVAPVAANVTAGSTSQAVVFTSIVNGDTVTAPLTVNINADQRRLLPSVWGVGFASTPTGTVLTRTIAISDNFAGQLAWTASSDHAWLKVTAAGTTGGASSLVLTADPSSLTDGTISYANVTVSTTTANVSPATIRVGLWKSATGVTAVTSLTGANPTTLTADKLAPLVYANSGGADIAVYNAYTASRVATIAGVGSALGQMAVSPDGSRLYVLDTTNRSMKVIDLGTLTVVDTWPLANAVSTGTNLIAIRPNGVEVVLVGDGTAYANGQLVGTPGISGRLTATDDGRKVYTTDVGYSPASVAAWDVDYSAMAGGTLFATVHPGAFDSTSGENGRDIAVTGDGSALYTASGSPYACLSVSPSDLKLIGALPGGNPYPNNVEVTSANQVVCGLQNAYNPADIMVYSPAGALVGSYKIAGYARGLQANELVVTPDGFIVVAETEDPLLAFVPIAH